MFVLRCGLLYSRNAHVMPQREIRHEMKRRSASGRLTTEKSFPFVISITCVTCHAIQRKAEEFECGPAAFFGGLRAVIRRKKKLEPGRA